VVAKKREISDLERTIASQPKKGRSEPSPTYLRYSQLKSELEGIQQRIAAYRRDQENLSAQMDTYSRRLESTPQHEKVIDDMERELKVGEMQFHALLDKQLDTKLAKGFEVILDHGDTLFMPAGYWHHMEYLDNGFAMSLRALQTSLAGKLKGAWYLLGMRHIDTLMKKTAPEWWFNLKKEKTFKAANKELETFAPEGI